MRKKSNIIKIFLFLGVFFLYTAFLAYGATDDNLSTTLDSDQNNSFEFKIAKVKKGEDVVSFNSNIKINIPENFVYKGAVLKISKLTEDIATTGSLKRISEIYQYDFGKIKINESAGFLTLKVVYNQQSNYYKRLFYYDNNFKKWRPLLSVDNYKKQTVEAKTKFAYARIAVFEDLNVPTTGIATWYSHKNGLFAASPDFAKGSRLRVFNLENGKFVDVDVNDFGPDRGVHPERVIDLEKPAFARLTSVKGGKVKVFIQPLHIVNFESNTNTAKSNIASKIVGDCSLVVNEKTGDIITSKNKDKVLPLASLTKLIAVSVFMDTKPNLDKIVTYKKQDEDFNYKYVDNNWESARLKVLDGETMKVRDWLYAALVGSANNSIEGLVRISGYSRDAFIKKMNETAKKWGAINTYFIEPTGLSPRNVSSCQDYAIITKEAFKNQTIAKISVTTEYDFDTINTKNHHHLKNTNTMLQNKKYNIVGSKTGYLYESGHCLMTRFNSKEGQTLIAVEFGTESKSAMFQKMYQLIDHGLAHTK